MKANRSVIAAAIFAIFTAGASASHFTRTSLAIEGVPQNLVSAMKADEGVPHNLVVALKADEGVPQNLVTA